MIVVKEEFETALESLFMLNVFAKLKVPYYNHLQINFPWLKWSSHD